LAIVETINHLETRGSTDCTARGASGESGCLQIMPGTWRMWSTVVYGEVVEMTPVRERYVVTKIISSWVKEGLSNDRIFLRYNAGGATQCSSGTNSHGVDYNSCHYVETGMNMLAMN